MKPLKPNKCNVTCEWMQAGRILINPDGQVFPCCYLAVVMHMVPKLVANMPTDDQYNLQNGPKWKITEQLTVEPVLMEYLQNKDDYNVFKRPLDEIIQSEWFTKTLPESWEDSDRLVLQCANRCSTIPHRSARLNNPISNHADKGKQ